MNVGVFFGSFNPLHMGHLAIARFFLEATSLDEVWFSVSPQNPWKAVQGLAPMPQRVAMAELAVASDAHIRVTDFEKDLPQPSYTYEALLVLAAQYPEHNIKLLIGGDNCHLFDNWRNYDKILERFEVLAYPRNASLVPASLVNKLKIVDAPLLDYASTDIREAIKRGGPVRGVSSEVLAYIEKYKIYKEA